MTRIDGFARDFSFSLEFQGGLQLGLKIIAPSQRHFGFLHELQKGRLDTATTHVASDHLSRAGNLVDFIDVNDSILGQRRVSVGFMNQFANEVFHISADIARFAEFCRVGFNERDADQIRDMLDQVSLAYSGRADQDDVLLRVFDLVRFLGGERSGVLRVMVMVANRDAESLFGIVLLDDEAIQMPFDISRGELKLEDRVGLLLGSRVVDALGRTRLRRRGETSAEKFLQALVQLLRRGQSGLAHGFVYPPWRTLPQAEAYDRSR